MNMINQVFVNYFLWFLVILAVLMYFYVALNNKNSVQLDFFGTKKKMSLKSLIFVSFLDGAVIGIILYYLINSSFF